MSEEIKIPVFENFKDKAHINKDSYEETYKFAEENPEEFWKEIAKELIG